MRTRAPDIRNKNSVFSMFSVSRRETRRCSKLMQRWGRSMVEEDVELSFNFQHSLTILGGAYPLRFITSPAATPINYNDLEMEIVNLFCFQRVPKASSCTCYRGTRPQGVSKPSAHSSDRTLPKLPYGCSFASLSSE